MKRSLVSLLCVCGLLILGAACSWAVEYRIRDLGSLGSGGGEARGINDLGQVVGMSWNANSERRAFLWQDGSPMQDLGVLDGGAFSEAYGINNSGQVVGFARNTQSGLTAFLWQNGAMQGLGDLGGNRSVAYAINDSGMIAGTGWDSRERDKAFVSDNGGPLQQIDARDGVANGINDGNQVAGWVGATAVVGGYIVAAVHASLWQGGVMQDLGTLGGNNSIAHGINLSGQVVGKSETAESDPWTHWSGTRAFLWQDGEMLGLGTLRGGYSIGYAINNSAQVVGESDSRAFLWQNGVMQELGGLEEGRRSGAYGINSRGQIAGYAYTSTGTHAVMWEPVPEPSSMLALSAGVVGAWTCCRKRRERRAS